MNSKLLVYLVVILAVAGVGYWAFKDKLPQYSSMSKDTLTVTLYQQNDSGEDGTATLTAKGDQTEVVVTLSNPPQGTPQPAHIHTGSCPTPGAVKYPLSNVVNGSSTTLVNVSLDTLKGMLPLAINIHKSAQQVSVYTSCGDL